MVSVNYDGGWHGNKLPTKLEDLPLCLQLKAGGLAKAHLLTKSYELNVHCIWLVL